MMKAREKYLINPHVVFVSCLWAEKIISTVFLFSCVGFLGTTCRNGLWSVWRARADGAVLCELFLAYSFPLSTSLCISSVFTTQLLGCNYTEILVFFLIGMDNWPSEIMFFQVYIFCLCVHRWEKMGWRGWRREAWKWSSDCAPEMAESLAWEALSWALYWHPGEQLEMVWSVLTRMWCKELEQWGFYHTSVLLWLLLSKLH